MKRQLQPWLDRLPSREQILAHRALRHVRPWLDHGYLWHPSRHNVPGALAAGVFAAMLPPPLQTVSAVVLALRFRLHLPAALLGTLLSNPFTILPLYWLAYEIGALLLGRPLLQFEVLRQTALHDFSALWNLLGWPWLLGLLVLTALLCALVACGTRLIWVWAIRRHWRQRQDRKRSSHF